MKRRANVDDLSPATTTWNDPRCNLRRSNDHTASSATSCSSKCESLRSKLTYATCNNCRASCEQDADLGVEETTRAGSPSPHPGLRVSRIQATAPNASTERVERGVSWSEVATVPKRKSHRGLDLNLSWNSEEDIWKGWKESNGTK